MADSIPAKVSFKRSQNETGANLKGNQLNIDDGTIYITSDQEMYLGQADKTVKQIAGNIIYQDPAENFTNPDALIKGSFDGHSIDEFVLKTDLGDLDFDFVPLSGGEMSGDLILNGNPSQANQAATKQYVDNSVPKIYRENITDITSGQYIINIPNNIQDYDNMMVYQNGLLLIKDLHYSLNEANKRIELIGYALNAGESITFTGPLYSNANLKGEKGEPFTYEDFTSSQLADLRMKYSYGTSIPTSLQLGEIYFVIES